MDIQNLIILIFFQILGIDLSAIRIGKIRNIDSQCGYEGGTEHYSEYLYAKVNELNSADNCDDEADDP